MSGQGKSDAMSVGSVIIGCLKSFAFKRSSVSHTVNIKKDHLTITDSTVPKEGFRKPVKPAQRHRLWQAGKDNLVAMLGISARKRLTLGMSSAVRKFAPDGSYCSS